MHPYQCSAMLFIPCQLPCVAQERQRARALISKDSAAAILAAGNGRRGSFLDMSNPPGYGGGVTIRLKDNGIEPTSFNGATESIEKTKDGQLEFANKRAEVWWKFREALDPINRTVPQSHCLPILS